MQFNNMAPQANQVILNKVHTGFAQQLGFDAQQWMQELNYMMSVANSYISGVDQAQILPQLYARYKDRFDFEEGNKRIVLVPLRGSQTNFVFKMSRFRGYEGMKDNIAEFTNSIEAYNIPELAAAMVVPRPIALVGDNFHQGLIEIQEKVVEPIKDAAYKLGASVQIAQVQEAFKKQFIMQNALEIDQALKTFGKYFYIDDLHKLRSAKNFGINVLGKVCFLDIGSCMFKFGTELKCTVCGGRMDYIPEDNDGLIGVGVLESHKKVAKYVCCNDMMHTEETGDVMQEIRRDLIDNWGNPQLRTRVVNPQTLMIKQQPVMTQPPNYGYNNIQPPVQQDVPTQQQVRDTNGVVYLLGTAMLIHPQYGQYRNIFTMQGQPIPGFGATVTTGQIIKVI